MNKQEAIQAMKDGKKVTHSYFTPDEWATMEGSQIVLEDGVSCDPSEFWSYRTNSGFDDDWSIFEEPKIEPVKKTREEMLQDLSNQYRAEFADKGYPEEFKPDGCMTQCNFGGLLIILSNTGDSVVVWSDWSDCALSTKLEECQIEYHDSDDPDDNESYVSQFYYQETWYDLNDFMRI